MPDSLLKSLILLFLPVSVVVFAYVVLYHGDQRLVQALFTVYIGTVAALVVSTFTGRFVLRLVQSSETMLDDLAIQHLRIPLALTLFFGGLSYGVYEAGLDEGYTWLIEGLLFSVLTLMWTIGLSRLGSQAIRHTSQKNKHRSALVTPRTQPLLEIALRIAIFGIATYFFFVAWELDLTGWLTSASIVGVAAGLAAQHTLANLFAGLAIIADSPYRLGDILLLDDGERGRVTQIGMRTTRIRRVDDVEVVVPNDVIANARLVNESRVEGGARVAIPVGVAYGSDIDQVREALLDVGSNAINAMDHLCPNRGPEVQFRQFGASGLDFVLLVWQLDPAHREEVIDYLHVAIYKRFAALDIEIPYTKIDVALTHSAFSVDPREMDK